jgi:hypothetical protein
MRRHDDLGVAGQLELADVTRVIRYRKAADFRIVFWRHGDFGERLDAFVAPPDDAAIGANALVAIGIASLAETS